MQEELLQHQEAEVLYVSDLKKLFRCGDCKARLILQSVPVTIKIGQRDAVFRTDLERYLREHGGVSVKWPKRRR